MSHGAGAGKGIEAILIPVVHHLLGRVPHVKHMQVDGLCLADTVESADPLLQQVGIERQVE